MELDGRKIALLVEDLYEDLELWYPYHRLREEGADVDVLGTGDSTYESKHGYEVTADYKIDHAVNSNYDAVVIPGGYAPDRMRRYPPMVRFVREIAEADKVCAAICHAGSMLISAGVVEGATLTSYDSIRDDLEAAGAQWRDQPVVRDGNLITSRKPDDLAAFCREIIGALSES